MKTQTARLILLLASLALCGTSACTYTVAGKQLPTITPPQPSFQPAVEQTVGDFAFTLEGGKMITSNLAGRILNTDLMNSWKNRGYIKEAKYVESSSFSGKADYNVTLSGTQYGESSVAMQIISGLTLMLLPHSVTQRYDIQYTVEDVRTGEKYSTSVQESDKAYNQLFLVLALPVAARGHQDTVKRMGDHLYDQLYKQGAFQRAGAAPVDSP